MYIIYTHIYIYIYIYIYINLIFKIYWRVDEPTRLITDSTRMSWILSGLGLILICTEIFSI